MKTKQNKNISLKNIKIQDDFWSRMQELIIDTVIPYQEKILNDQIPGVEKSHAVANFKIAAGMEEGEFYGMVFQDSDVAKWLEGVAYSLTVKPDPELEKRADAVIDIIEKAQQPDGYLNTYFTVKEPEHRWQNLQECHELYCAGHMMEAAAAYYDATGKDKLLRIMEKMADHIDRRFGPEKETGIPGHQEVEIGLMRLYHTTGEERYRKLAEYFLNERGKNPDFFWEESKKRGWTHFGIDPKDTMYNQSYATVYEQKEAVGHSVRAVYMYTAMADLAGTSGDDKLYKACCDLWDNMTEKRMYLTGGIGSTGELEAFTKDYDLPNDMVYAETCASIGLIFFAKQMLEIEADGRYADVMERAFYNSTISGMQADGKRFFYVNPLISGEVPGYKHVLPQRPGWYACACCPPNLVRLVTSIGRYAWDETEDAIYSHLFLGQTAAFEKAEIRVESAYPWEGSVRYHINSLQDKEFTLAIHIPSYVNEASVMVNGKKCGLAENMKKGYLCLTEKWGADDVVEITFDMKVRKVYANQEVKGTTCIRVKGYRYKNSGRSLYTEEKPTREDTYLTAVPYYIWGNRGENQMRVWMLEE